MGFSQEACLSALAAANGDENRALNVLLGETSNPPPAGPGSTATANASGADAAPSAQPAKPSKPSGLFGKVWGKSPAPPKGTKEASPN
jgi:hypothetical protein